MERRRTSGGYAFSILLAFLAAGLLYMGVLLLTDTRRPQPRPVVTGAIRLAQPEPEALDQERPERSADEPEPPRELPKTFAAPRQSRPRPNIDLNMPSFAPQTHPGISGGVSLPAGVGDYAGFTLDEVDEPPRPVRSVPPDYPYAAKKDRIEGQVVLRMLVTSDGTPTNITVHSADPPGVFEKAALDAAKRWRFKPGRYAGRDVDTWVLLPFNFELVQ